MLIASGGEFRLKGLVGLPVIQSRNAAVASFQLHQHLWQFAVRCRPGNEGHIGCALKDSLAFLLRDATEHGKALPLFVQRLIVVQAIENLLLRLIAD